MRRSYLGYLSWQLLVAASLSLATGCMTLDHRFLLAGYQPQQPEAIKRIEVRTWSAKEQPLAGQLVGLLAADILRLRSNYLIKQIGPVKRHWAESCAEQSGPEGILLLAVHQADIEGVAAHVALSASLYRCLDGALLWRTQAETTAGSNHPSLTAIKANYLRQIGPEVDALIVPMYYLLRPLLEDIPDPILTDDDIMERIELEEPVAPAEPTTLPDGSLARALWAPLLMP